MKKAKLKKSGKVQTYGAPRIKKEKNDDDPPAAFQHPSELPTATHEESYDSDVNCHMKQLENIPIVYTTRLDDMNAIISSNFIPEPSDFFQGIMDESRPHFTPEYFKRLAPYVNRFESYFQLTRKIHKVNVTLRRKAGWLRQNKQDKLKKQDKIIHEVPSVSNIHIRTTRGDKTPLPIPIVKIKDIMTQPLLASESQGTKFQLFYYSYRNNYFVIRNTKTNEADVYYFNDNGTVTQHYISDNKLDSIYTPTIKNAEVPYCCWYQREEYISLMERFLPAATVKYLKKPHTCAISQCKCCCRNKFEYFNKTNTLTHGITTIFKSLNKSGTTKNAKASGKKKKNMEEKQIYSAQIIENLTAESIVVPIKISFLIDEMLNTRPSLNPPPALVRKAFAFYPKEVQKLRPNKKNNVVHRNVNIFMDYTIGWNEYYQIGPEGEIRQHLVNVTESLIQEGLPSDENFLHEKICCWQKRELFLNSLKTIHMLPQLKYMKNPHNCPIYNCSCCCKPLKKRILANLKDIILPESPNHSHNYYSKIPPLKFAFANNEPCITDNTVSKPLEVIPPSIEEVDEVMCCTQEDIVTKVPVDKEGIIESLSENYKHICDNARVLLAATLNNFNNVGISVNEKGKVTAALNFPVTKLTTNELKILNQILMKAQKDVDIITNKSVKPTPKIVLNNVAYTSLSSKSKTTSNTAISCNKIKLKKQVTEKKFLYATMSIWSENHDSYLMKSLNTFFRFKKYNKMQNDNSVRRKRKCETDKEQHGNGKPQKRRGTRKETNQSLKIEETNELNSNNEAEYPSTNNNSVDPLAIYDNDLKPTIPLIHQTDLTALYGDGLLLKTETLEETSTAFPVTMIVKKAVSLPQGYLQPTQSVGLQVPVTPASGLLNSTNTNLDEEVNPNNSIIGLNDKEITQDFDDNSDCILGV